MIRVMKWHHAGHVNHKRLLSVSLVNRQLTLVLFGKLDEVCPQHFIVGALQNTIQVVTLGVHSKTAWSTATCCPLYWHFSSASQAQLDITNTFPEAQMHWESDYPAHSRCQVRQLLREGQESSALQLS